LCRERKRESRHRSSGKGESVGDHEAGKRSYSRGTGDGERREWESRAGAVVERRAERQGERADAYFSLPRCSAVLSFSLRLCFFLWPLGVKLESLAVDLAGESGVVPWPLAVVAPSPAPWLAAAVSMSRWGGTDEPASTPLG